MFKVFSYESFEVKMKTLLNLNMNLITEVCVMQRSIDQIKILTLVS